MLPYLCVLTPPAALLIPNLSSGNVDTKHGKCNDHTLHPTMTTWLVLLSIGVVHYGQFHLTCRQNCANSKEYKKIKRSI